MPRARYSPPEIELFRVLRGLASRAMEDQDPALLGRVATISSQVSQRHLPKPGFEHLLQLAEETRACGIQVSHSGTVAGLVFDPQSNGVRRRLIQAAKLLHGAGFEDVTSFTVGAGGPL
jgi:uncharacterized protein involved in propanediol utilization